MKRLNKQYKLNFENVDGIYGSINKDEPLVIYLTVKWWVQTNNSCVSKSQIEDCCKTLKTDFEQQLKNIEGFQNKLLFVPMETTNSIESHDKRYCSFDAYIMQEVKHVRKLTEIQEDIFRLTQNTNNIIVNCFGNAKVFPKKTQHQ